MGVEVFDLWVTVMGIAALVLVARFRRQLRAEHRQSYDYIGGGLVILTLVSLTRMYHNLGLFDSISFVSDPLFFKLISWIGIITGITLTVSGIADWLPLSREYRRCGEARIRRLELIKRIEQLVAVESRLPVVLRKGLQYMIGEYGLNRGGVYIYSRRARRIVRLSTFPDTNPAPGDLDSLLAGRTVFCEATDCRLNLELILRQWPASEVKPAILLPVDVDDRPVGFFLLWGDGARLTTDDRINLKIASEIMGRKIQLDRQQRRINYLRERQELRRRMRQAVDRRKEIKDNMVRLMRAVRETIDFDFAALTIAHNPQDVQRFSVGENDTLLKEMGLDFTTFQNQLRRLPRRGRPTAIADGEKQAEDICGRLLDDNAMRCQLSFPLTVAGSLDGILTIASKQPDKFSSADAAVLADAADFLQELVAEEKLRQDLQERERMQVALNGFLADVALGLDAGEVLDRAAAMLSEELKTTIVRISTFDPDAFFLNSRSLALQRPLQKMTPADGHMILSLMPYHSLVRDTARLMMVNQENSDNKVGEAEATQCFCKELKSALLVPVKAGETVLGVISLADIRCWERYHYQQAHVLLVSAVASVLARVLTLPAPAERYKRDIKVGLQSLEGARYLPPEARSRINSSLSGILGSVEMIRAQPASETAVSRYLAIIDKSARNIGECFTEDISV
ncbi:MAG: hypothetical protein OEW00_05035 [candidate division Zixibacteria bacterium]|nr:hypothetical protein [candidate division Zixibacteria bacterium]